LAKKCKYDWRIGEELPSIDSHSLVKLDIIERYMEIYLKFLTKGCFTSSLKLTIIDGFSGGGLYKGNIAGSPLRIKKAIASAEKIIEFEKEKANCVPINFHIDFKFIEKKKDTFLFLKKTLKDFSINSPQTECIFGEFSSHLTSIIKYIKNKGRAERAIFILDQYGYSDAPIKDVYKIFTNLKNAEVILTFSMDSLIDYLSKSNPNTLLNLGLKKDDVEKILDLKEDSDFSRAKLQPLLYQSIVAASGAKYFTPFFIKCDSSNRSYWLFHFSSHPTARDEMIKLHWNKQNTFCHYGKAGLNMLVGYDSKYNNSIFKFDNFAKENSIKLLSEELPKIIYNQQEISFGKLRNIVINQTPATIDIIKESLAKPMDTREIFVKSSDKKSNRLKSSRIKNDDLLIWRGRKQCTLFD
jgi:three-Cys-motif partner protein